jgi:hypothetical protein
MAFVVPFEEKCRVFAAAVAAISVTRMGAQPSMPSMNAIEDFLKQRIRSSGVTRAVARS